MNLGQPPPFEPGRQIRGEPEAIPGQLTLPGMPPPAEAGATQPTLPGREIPTAGGLAADGSVAHDGAAHDRAAHDRAAHDRDLAAVAAELSALDGDGSRMAAAIRGALDMLLDGQHTGRYRWDQLHKTEKTHAGTLVEIALARALRLAEIESALGALPDGRREILQERAALRAARDGARSRHIHGTRPERVFSLWRRSGRGLVELFFRPATGILVSVLAILAVGQRLPPGNALLRRCLWSVRSLSAFRASGTSVSLVGWNQRVSFDRGVAGKPRAHAKRERKVAPELSFTYPGATIRCTETF